MPETLTLFDRRLQQVFREALENDQLILSGSLSAETLPEWDSVAQVKLIMGCEEEFDVKFTMDELTECISVAGFKAVLARKGVGR